MSNSNMEYFNELIAVTSSTDQNGQLMPQRVVWRDNSYMIITVGRQWDEADNRHVLVETSEGVRFEIKLQRADLTWWICKVWWNQILA